MRSILLSVAIVSLALAGGCGGPRSPDHQLDVGYVTTHWPIVARIGAGDVESVIKALDTAEVDAFIEGNTMRDVRVPPEKRDRAARVLRADAKRRGYKVHLN